MAYKIVDSRSEPKPPKRAASEATKAAMTEAREIIEAIEKKKLTPYQMVVQDFTGPAFAKANATSLKNVGRKVYLYYKATVHEKKLPYEVTSRVVDGKPKIYIAAAA